jgi:hypothetical protein
LQQPTVNDPGASALERSLQVMPQTLAQLGGVGVQMAELEQRRQQAQDVLDATLADQAWAQAHQEHVAALEQGDYRQLPTAVMDEGRRLQEQIAQERSLSPQARAMYQARVQERLTVAQQRALTVRSKRQDEEKSYALGTALHETQQRVANATSSYERELALGQWRETAQEFVRVGLLHGATAADMEAKLTETIQVQDNQNAIQHDPAAMTFQYTAQLAGQPTREDLPLAPVSKLAQLHQQALEVRKQRRSEAEHVERYDEWKLTRQQEQNTVSYTTQIYTTPPTMENAPTFERLTQQIAQAMRTGDLDPRQGEHLMQVAQAHAQAAKKPSVVADDPAVERELSYRIYTAQTPQDFTRARDLLTQRGLTALKPETYRTLADKLESRTKASWWRDRPAVKAAYDILVRGVVVPYGGQLAGQMKPRWQQKLSWATDAWEAEMLKLQDTPAQMDQRASDLAWDMRLKFLVPDTDDVGEEYLPPPVKAATTPDQLKMVMSMLRDQGWAPETLWIIKRNWETYQAYLRASQERRGGAMPTSPGMAAPAAAPPPKSYQLPGMESPSTSEPRSK